MTIISDSHTLDFQPLSSLLVTTVISALTILTAFALRDTVVQLIQLIAPNDATKKFIFSLMIAMFFLFITVLLAFLWQDKLSD
jgi:hypothetical protein